MIVKLLTEHHLEFLRLKGGCTGLSESTLVKTPHCWKSHVTAYLLILSHRDTKRSVILENVGCGSGCGGFSRTFRVDWDLWLGDHEGKDLLPAFFDLNDNVSYNEFHL